ncbi:hypothetical protein [Streptomyces sp. NBC_01506]|uniref:hypothetical protein n=1 Tax=Streptomyces sp. NBC_01506 TaxID=2903887 RepID=UPI00386D9D64
MSDSVFVVQEEPTGRWIAACCDTRCGHGMHTLADTETKRAADAAATRHRRLLKTMPPNVDKPLTTDTCDTCGQSKRAIEQLQQLVAELEAQ